ncbi:MAG: hypothetical protein ACR2LE_06170 [Nocardioidaceae bacterium]
MSSGYKVADTSRMGRYQRGPQRRALSAEVMKRITDQRWTEDFDNTRAISVQNGSTACAYVWECDECGKTVRGPSIGNHQQSSGHEGRTLIDVGYLESESA